MRSNTPSRHDRKSAWVVSKPRAHSTWQLSGLTSTQRVVARKDVLPFLVSGAQGTACLGENVERDDDQLMLRIPLRHTFNEIIDECESLILQNALKENGWNKSRVTKALGIPRQSLYNKIARYGLKKPVPAAE